MTTLFGAGGNSCPLAVAPTGSPLGPPSLVPSGRGRKQAPTNQQRIKLSRDLMLKLSAALSANQGCCKQRRQSSSSMAQSKPRPVATDSDAAQPTASASDGDRDAHEGDSRPPLRLLQAGQSIDGCKEDELSRRHRAVASSSDSFSANSLEDCAATEMRKPVTDFVWQQKVGRSCCRCRLKQQHRRRPRARGKSTRSLASSSLAATGNTCSNESQQWANCDSTPWWPQADSKSESNSGSQLELKSVFEAETWPEARTAEAAEVKVEVRVEVELEAKVEAKAGAELEVETKVEPIDCGTNRDQIDSRSVDYSLRQRRRHCRRATDAIDDNDESLLTAEGAAIRGTSAPTNAAPTSAASTLAGRPTRRAEISSSKTASTSERRKHECGACAANSSSKNRRNTRSSSNNSNKQQQQENHHHATFTCEPNSNSSKREPHKCSVIPSSSSSSLLSSRPLKRAASQPLILRPPTTNRSSIAKPRRASELKTATRKRQERQTKPAASGCASGGVARPQSQLSRGAGRRRSSASCCWPAAGGFLLMISLFVCLLSGSSSGNQPDLDASSGRSTSDELSRAVLATMSTQSPPGAYLAPSEYANDTSGGFVSDAATTTTTTTTMQAPSSSTILDRFLDFGRIFIMSAIIVGDICGNSLVILSVCRHTKLRVTTNWFVVSLACADILVALFAMTFNASVIISGRWLFKRWVCDFWNSCDVLASTASILHLCCISIDRYIAIMRPLDYPMKITTRRVMYALCGVWISSALLSYIPIFTGIYTTAEHIEWLRENPDQCDFVVNRVYAIVSSSISFWIPCCIMVFTYYRIYREATRQEKFIYNAQKIMPAPQPNHHHHHQSNSKTSGANAHKRRSKSVAAASASAGSDQQARIRHLAKQQLEQQKQQLTVATTELNSASSLTPVGPSDRAGSLQQLPLGSEPLAKPAAPAASDSNNSSSSNGNGKTKIGFDKTSDKLAVANKKQLDVSEDDDDDEPDSNSGQSTPTKRSISKMKREHKAAKTLGIIMGVFILCWLPFFSWYTPQHICGKACDAMVPGWAVTILFWIGYFNSTLNPIIYAYFNSEFRDAFKKTLQWIFCCCQDLKCLRVQRPNDNQHYNCTYRSTQEIGLVSNG